MYDTRHTHKDREDKHQGQGGQKRGRGPGGPDPWTRARRSDPGTDPDPGTGPDPEAGPWTSLQDWALKTTRVCECMSPLSKACATVGDVLFAAVHFGLEVCEAITAQEALHGPVARCRRVEVVHALCRQSQTKPDKARQRQDVPWLARAVRGAAVDGGRPDVPRSADPGASR